MVCLDEGVVSCLDNNNKDNFDVDIRNSFDDCFGYFLHAHRLKYLLKVTLDGQFISHHDHMKKGGWSETYFRSSYFHEHKNPTI